MSDTVMDRNSLGLACSVDLHKDGHRGQPTPCRSSMHHALISDFVMSDLGGFFFVTCICYDYSLFIH